MFECHFPCSEESRRHFVFLLSDCVVIEGADHLHHTVVLGLVVQHGWNVERRKIKPAKRLRVAIHIEPAVNDWGAALVTSFRKLLQHIKFFLVILKVVVPIDWGIEEN